MLPFHMGVLDASDCAGDHVLILQG